VPDDAKFEVVAHIAKHLKAEHHRVVDIDGVRVIFEDGWGLIRASNTQPALVLRVEAQSAARRDELLGRLRGWIREAELALGV
jgi:phosphomannomutase/phosphoglucomutase